MKRFFFDARKIKDYGIGTYIRCLLPELWKLGANHVTWIIGHHRNHSVSSLFSTQPPPTTVWLPLRSSTYNPIAQIEIPYKLRTLHLHLAHFPHFPVPFSLKTRIVVTIHDTILLKKWSKAPFSLKPRIARLYLKETLENADAIVTVSHAAARAIRAIFDPGNRPIIVAHNAPHPIFMHSPSPSTVQRWMYRLSLPEQGYLLYVGNLKPHKNVDRLIQAWKIIYRRFSIPLVLAGLPKPARQKITRAYPEETLKGTLLVLPWLPMEALVVVYHRASVLILPSLAEGFGLPLLEAMACGTPVVCSDIDVFHEIADEAAVYFDPYDCEAMARAIESVLSNSDLALHLSTRGPQRAKRFSWTDSAVKIWQLYRLFYPDLPEPEPVKTLTTTSS